MRKAVQVARYQLLQEVVRLKCNILLSEGYVLLPVPRLSKLTFADRWRCTLMRQGHRHRVEVVYSGRPARAMGKVTRLPQPPFIAVLDHCEYQPKRHQEPQRRGLFRSWSRTLSMS